MKVATVVDLRNHSAIASKRIHDGEQVVITKRGPPFATLTPSRERPVLPPLNRMARLEKTFPDGDARD